MGKVRMIYLSSLKRVLCSVRSYIYCLAVLVGLTVITAVYNISRGIPSTEIGLMYLTVPMMFLFPLVTAGNLCDDIKSGVFRFYISSGAGCSDIVIANLLVSYGFLLLPVLYMLTLSVIMSFFAQTAFSAAVVSIIGFALIGIAVMSALCAVSAACERKITAYAVSYGLIVFFFVFGIIYDNLPFDRTAAVAVCLVISALPAGICYYFSRSVYLSAPVFLIMGIITVAVSATSTENAVLTAKKLLGFFVPNTAQSGFYFGILDFRSVILLFSFSLVCAVITYFSLKGRQISRKENK